MHFRTALFRVLTSVLTSRQNKKLLYATFLYSYPPTSVLSLRFPTVFVSARVASHSLPFLLSPPTSPLLPYLFIVPPSSVESIGNSYFVRAPRRPVIYLPIAYIYYHHPRKSKVKKQKCLHQTCHPRISVKLPTTTTLICEQRKSKNSLFPTAVVHHRQKLSCRSYKPLPPLQCSHYRCPVDPTGG